MTAFLDKDGFPLTMGTHLSNVNLEVTTSESIDRTWFLAAWDATKLYVVKVFWTKSVKK